MIRHAAIGGGVWLTIVIASRIFVRFDRTWIELLFLFAPLVIVPLGLELTGGLTLNSLPQLRKSWLLEFSCRLHLPLRCRFIVARRSQSHR